MICPRCETHNVPGADYCARCGWPLASPTPPVDASTTLPGRVPDYSSPIPQYPPTVEESRRLPRGMPYHGTGEAARAQARSSTGRIVLGILIVVALLVVLAASTGRLNGLWQSATSAIAPGGGAGGPAAAFTYTLDQGDPSIVHFDASSSRGTNLAYAWDFGDQSTQSSGDTLTPTHHYATSGAYRVALTVTDGSQRRATTAHEITITTPATTNPCDQLAEFRNAGTADAGSDFSDVTFPADSVGYEAKNYVDGSYTFILLPICSGATTVQDVQSYFAQSLPGVGWSSSDTYPYHGDPTAACGDPYCWVSQAAQVRYASLEDVRQNGSAVTYSLRLGALSS
ncbi:MAG: hypothetical protein OJF49_004376 [Ktedonobacterales bacterium]|nr:MAG: hypothetical protein OJF49_004376 [Ktedonobacterales bacterium]